MTWQIKKIGEICDLATGGTPSRANLEYFKNGTIKWLVSGDINKREIFDCAGRITEKGMRNSNTKILPLNSVMIALNGQGKTRGMVAMLRTEATCNQSLVSIFPKNPKELMPEYIYRNLYGRYEEIRKITGDNGNDRRGLNMSLIKGLEIPLPSIAEQKVIVKTLDELFERVLNAKENTEKNLLNSKELFESYLQGVFSSPSKDWEEKTLADLSKRKDGIVSGPFGSNLKVSDYKDKGVPILRLQNIGKGYFIDKSIKYISEAKANELKYHSFVSGDIALAKLGIPIGKTCIIPDHFKSGIITADIVRIRPDLKIVDYQFLTYFLNTNLSVAQLTSNISGSTRPRVNLSDVRNIKLTLPSLKQQKIIVKKLNELSFETKKLEKIYEQKLADLEELQKSVLKKAFSGELNTVYSSRVATPVVQVDIPSPYIRNQIHAAIIEQVKKDGGDTTEVAVAKYDHILQEVLGMNLGYEFQAQQFGPFDAKIKNLISSGLTARNKWFTKKGGMIVLGSNSGALLSRQSNLYRTAQSKMKELANLGITKMKVDKIELLSTVSHSIKKTGSTENDKVRAFMSEWQTDGNRTKADKFNTDQTQKCLDFIILKNLHLKLL